jgi:enoyl-CoA hydratase
VAGVDVTLVAIPFPPRPSRRSGDTRSAAGNAKIGLTEVTAGIPFPACAMAVVQAELPPPVVRMLCLTGRKTDAEEGVALGLFDRVVAPAALVDDAMATAGSLAASPVYSRVKAQVRGPTSARLARIVADEDDPLLDGWV